MNAKEKVSNVLWVIIVIVIMIVGTILAHTLPRLPFEPIPFYCKRTTDELFIVTADKYQSCVDSFANNDNNDNDATSVESLSGEEIKRLVSIASFEPTEVKVSVGIGGSYVTTIKIKNTSDQNQKFLIYIAPWNKVGSGDSYDIDFNHKTDVNEIMNYTTCSFENQELVLGVGESKDIECTTEFPKSYYGKKTQRFVLFAANGNNRVGCLVEAYLPYGE